MPDLLAPLSILVAAVAGAGGAFIALRARFASQLSAARATHSAEVAATAHSHELELRAALDKAQHMHSLELREVKSQGDLSAQKVRSDLQERHAAALRIAEKQFNVRLKEQSESNLSVTVYPFVNTTRQRGVFSSNSLIEIGYKYQLLIQGLPCFEPHTVVVETTQEKEVNDETIELLKSKAVELAQLAANTKSGGLSGTAISIAKAVVKRIA